MRVLFTCPNCSSPNVLIDAFAEWDAATQEWVLQNIFPDQPLVCNDCGEETNYDTARNEEKE
jgi:hypothetical protein